MLFPMAEAPPPVRLLSTEVRSPFAPGRDAVLALVRGNGLDGLDVRDGDHVVLVRRTAADHGDLAAVTGPEGRAYLWKVFPEGGEDGVERLRLSYGSPAEGRLAPPGTRVQGVVVAVLRGAGGR
jgi:hypothetical protein